VSFAAGEVVAAVALEIEHRARVFRSFKVQLCDGVPTAALWAMHLVTLNEAVSSNAAFPNRTGLLI